MSALYLERCANFGPDVDQLQSDQPIIGSARTGGSTRPSGVWPAIHPTAQTVMPGRDAAHLAPVGLTRVELALLTVQQPRQLLELRGRGRGLNSVCTSPFGSVPTCAIPKRHSCAFFVPLLHRSPRALRAIAH